MDPTTSEPRAMLLSSSKDVESRAAWRPMPETIDGVPNLCGDDPLIATPPRDPARLAAPAAMAFAGVRAAFVIALHMHQPLIPARGSDLRTAELISNLRYMFEHP